MHTPQDACGHRGQLFEQVRSAGYSGVSEGAGVVFATWCVSRGGDYHIYGNIHVLCKSTVIPLSTCRSELTEDLVFWQRSVQISALPEQNGCGRPA